MNSETIVWKGRFGPFDLKVGPATFRPSTISMLLADCIVLAWGYVCDMFDALPEAEMADVVIGDVSGIPDELASVSGWFPSGLSGGPTGAELPMRMLDEAKRLLRKGGTLLLPT